MPENYPDMISEGWTIAKAEEFANDYGLVMNVKDKNGKIKYKNGEPVTKVTKHTVNTSSNLILKGTVLTNIPAVCFSLKEDLSKLAFLQV